MQQALVVNFGLEGKSADQLRSFTQERGVSCKDIRDPKACLRTLDKAAMGVVVLRLGRHLESELTLLQQIHRLHPDVKTIVIADTDNPLVAGLAWDLGAAFVLSRPLPIELLPDLVGALLTHGDGHSED